MLVNTLRRSLNQSLTKIEDHPLLYTLWGVFLLCLCAQISIPLEPVPITLQTVGVMLVGLTFPRKIAIQSILGYLAMGAIGLPVFADFSGGYAVFLRPSGGYLIGFFFSILVMSYFTTRQQNTSSLVFITANCVLGTCTIFVFGILGLMRMMDFAQAIQVGLLPFILPGLVKIALLAISLKYLRTGLLK